jgi:hypothetical protein
MDEKTRLSAPPVRVLANTKGPRGQGGPFRVPDKSDKKNRAFGSVSRFHLLSDGFRVRRCVIDKKDKKDRKIGDKPFPRRRAPDAKNELPIFFKNTFSRFLYLFYLFYLRANTPLKPRHPH